MHHTSSWLLFKRIYIPVKNILYYIFFHDFFFPLWGFRRADSEGGSSHFTYSSSKAPPNGSPTSQRSQSFESDRRGPAPQPLPRRSLVRSSNSWQKLSSTLYQIIQSITSSLIGRTSSCSIEVIMAAHIIMYIFQEIYFIKEFYPQVFRNRIFFFIDILSSLALWLNVLLASRCDDPSGWGTVRLPGRPPRWAELLWGTGTGGLGTGGQRLVGAYHNVHVHLTP